MSDRLVREQEIIDEIVAKSGGSVDNMNYKEIEMLHFIFKRRKKSIDEFIKKEYYKIKLWAELDLEAVFLDKMGN